MTFVELMLWLNLQYLLLNSQSIAVRKSVQRTRRVIVKLLRKHVQSEFNVACCPSKTVLFNVKLKCYVVFIDFNS